MHFSLIAPAPGEERAAAHDWARGAYQHHQWLWRFFPAQEGSPRTFLFRRHDVDGLPRFYLVSAAQPLTPSAHWVVQSKPYAPVLSVGDILRFDLLANPVVTTRSPAGQGARHDVVMHEKTRLLKERGIARWADWRSSDRPSMGTLVQQCGTAWLRHRASQLGVTFDEQSLRADGYQQHRGKNGQLKFSAMSLTGRLEVREPTALLKALYLGVGHAKAFGCGLLMVRPDAAA